MKRNRECLLNLLEDCSIVLDATIDLVNTLVDLATFADTKKWQMKKAKSTQTKRERIALWQVWREEKLHSKEKRKKK
jgi:FMN phosphatase YigB (HAD superfamily)